ncbi:unnamed protein product [Sphagnum compactum]
MARLQPGSLIRRSFSACFASFRTEVRVDNGSLPLSLNATSSSCLERSTFLVQSSMSIWQQVSGGSIPTSSSIHRISNPTLSSNFRGDDDPQRFAPNTTMPCCDSAAWSRRSFALGCGFRAHSTLQTTSRSIFVNNDASQVLMQETFNGKREESEQPWEGVFFRSFSSGHEKQQPQHTTTKLDGGRKYSVVQINSDGSWQSRCLNSTELGIHPRDIDLLANVNPFIPQRSIVSVRNEKILVRMENVKALVCKDYVLLFEARRPRARKEKASLGAAPSISNHPEKAMHRAREMFAEYMTEQAQEPFGHPLDAMPFHLRMMECILDETSNFFYQKAERLKVIVERMLEELTDDVNLGGLQRLLPLKRALTEVEHDVRDTHIAMEQVLDSDDMLESLCLNNNEYAWPLVNEFNTKRDKERNPNLPTLRQAAADMILTYQRQIGDVGGALEELRKDLNAAQEIWELGLDTKRNRIIRLDLLFSMGTLSFSIAALIATFFGMNLTSGFEEHPQLFWWVVAGSMAMSLSVGATLSFIINVWPRFDNNRRARDVTGLRDLLGHLDDIDDIFQAVGQEAAGRTITLSEFKAIIHAHPSAKYMHQRELDFMFRMFDKNRDGFLEVCFKPLPPL